MLQQRTLMQSVSSSASEVVLSSTSLENRGPSYRNNVNSRGEVPALVLDNGFVLIETPAICEYLDEVPTSGTSFFSTATQEWAETRMWLRRMSLEIAQSVISWLRNNPVLLISTGEIEYRSLKRGCCRKLWLVMHWISWTREGMMYLCCDKFSAADMHFYGLVRLMTFDVKFMLAPGRKKVMRYLRWWDKRGASVAACQLGITWSLLIISKELASFSRHKYLLLQLHFLYFRHPNQNHLYPHI